MQKGFPLILIAVAVAIGGYFLYQQQTKSTPVTPLIQTATQPSPKSDETANWKTYVNKTYKFSLKYPPTLRVSSNGDFVADLVDATVNQANITPKNIKVRISVNQINRNFDKIYAAQDNSVIAEEQHALDAKFTKIMNRTISAYKAIDYKYEVPGNQTEKSFTTGTIVNKNGILIEISTNEMDTTEFNQILSTFKFLGREETTIDHGNTVVVYEPPLSNQDYLTNRNILEQKVVSPFIDYWKEKESKDYVVSLLISLQKNENIKNDYPYQLIAINKGGGQIYESLRQVGGQLDWWIPTCQKCEFSNEFTTKYPEIVKRTQ